MAEINGEEKRIGVSGEQIEEAVGKVPTIEADVKANKQNISALQTASAQHTADIAKNTADIALKANAEEVYTISQTVEAVTETVAEIVANADDDFDTLRELSDWLKNHSGSAAEMNTAIQTNTKAIADNATAIEANTAEIANNKSDILSRLPWRYGAANANENTNKWYRLGRFETTTMNNTFNSILLVHDRRGRENGILTITIEKKNNAETDTPSAFDSEIIGEWISAETQTNSTYQKRNNFVIVAWVEDTKLICELWCKIYQPWNIYYALQLVNNRMATDVSKSTSNPELGWVLEVTKTPYVSHPLASDTVRVVQTSDKLAEALAKINDFENRITALETAQTTASD